MYCKVTIFLQVLRFDIFCGLAQVCMLAIPNIHYRVQTLLTLNHFCVRVKSIVPYVTLHEMLERINKTRINLLRDLF